MLVGSLTAALTESEGTDLGNPDIVKYAESLGQGPKTLSRCSLLVELCPRKRGED
jgi:hypothetical protein